MMSKRIAFIILCFSLLCVLNQNSLGQILYTYPQIDTLYALSGCTEPYIEIRTFGNSSARDTITLSAGFNTDLSFLDSTGSRQFIYSYCYEIDDPTNQNRYEFWYSPVDSWYDSLNHIVPMDTCTIFFGSFYLILKIYNNDSLTDSLPQFIIAESRGMGIDNDVRRLSEFSLSQNYPNPFNATTTIQYEIPQTAHVILTIYNLNGRLIERLVDRKQEAGEYTVNWSAVGVPTGIYFYRLQAGNSNRVKKMVIIK